MTSLAQNLAQLVNQIPGRNRLINGGMNVDQRNSGGAMSIANGNNLGIYTVDRWYAHCLGAPVTGQRVVGGETQNRYQFTGASSVTSIDFGQRIEQANSFDLNGQTVTLSVDLANSLLTQVTWTAYYANTADSFGTLGSPTRTQIATGTFNVTPTIARYTTQIAIPAAANTGIEIVLGVGAQTSGTWTIGNAQLEVGAKATQFERRQYGIEYALCQRYYQAAGLTTFVGSGASQSATLAYVQIALNVALRALPTINYSGLVQLYGPSSGVANVTSVASVYSSGGFLAIGVSTASGQTVGQAVILYTNNGTITFSAEL